MNGKTPTNEEVVMRAMRREYARLSKVAERAKAEADENATIGTEYVAIHKELAEIMNSSETGEAVIRSLEALKARRDRAAKVLKKDLVKLMDKQHRAEIERDYLAEEISLMEFRQGLRASQ